MIVGIPREIKQGEGRVAVTPPLVKEIAESGHSVLIEEGAGNLSGFSDAEFLAAGAKIVDRSEVWDRAELLLKVKEPIAEEYGLLRPDMTLFCFLHLAAEPDLTQVLLEHHVTALAFETLEVEGRLPILEPMSIIAGRLSALWAAFLLQRTWGGRGILPGGLPGSAGANVLVLGGGSVGGSAADVMQGLRANVTVSEPSDDQAQRLQSTMREPINIVNPLEVSIDDLAAASDVIIGAVLLTGAASPILVSDAVVKSMRPGSVICDVAIDQGGCVETSRPTSHESPTFVQHDVVHQCITNLPAAVSRDSTLALTSALRPYLRALLSVGIEKSLDTDPVLRSALNTRDGSLVHAALTGMGKTK